MGIEDTTPITTDLSETQQALKEKIALLKAEADEANSKLWCLIGTCTHAYRRTSWDGAKCAICDNEMGWWCPESPDGTCDYEQDDGSYDEDQCRYCGQPYERK